MEEEQEQEAKVEERREEIRKKLLRCNRALISTHLHEIVLKLERGRMTFGIPSHQLCRPLPPTPPPAPLAAAVKLQSKFRV